MQTIPPPVTKIYKHDISEEYLNVAYEAGIVACDIETSGLDWQVNKVATCQFYIPNAPAAIVKVSDDVPEHIVTLLSDKTIKKIFHHAMFDLRFMVHTWHFFPQNISCTKIASKLLDKSMEKHSLQALLDLYLKVIIDKSQQNSNWLSSNLTEEQRIYAIKDVLYLPALLGTLEQELLQRNLLNLAHACFKHIPTRIQLEIHGYRDVYLY